MTMMLRRALMVPAGGEPFPVGANILEGSVWLKNRLYNATTGEIEPNSTYAATENFIAINTAYSYKVNLRTFVYYYQSDGTYIERQVVQANGTLTIPQGAAKIRVCVVKTDYQTVTIIRTA